MCIILDNFRIVHLQLWKLLLRYGHFHLEFLLAFQIHVSKGIPQLSLQTQWFSGTVCVHGDRHLLSNSTKPNALGSLEIPLAFLVSNPFLPNSSHIYLVSLAMTACLFFLSHGSTLNIWRLLFLEPLLFYSQTPQVPEASYYEAWFQAHSLQFTIHSITIWIFWTHSFEWIMLHPRNVQLFLNSSSLIPYANWALLL